jgi:hypothetical protein
VAHADSYVTTEVDQESRMPFESHNPVAIAHVTTVDFQSGLRFRISRALEE